MQAHDPPPIQAFACTLYPVQAHDPIQAAGASDLTAAASHSFETPSHPHSFETSQHAASDLTIATPLRGVIRVRSPPRLRSSLPTSPRLPVPCTLHPSSLPTSPRLGTAVHTHVHAHVHAHVPAHAPGACGARTDVRRPSNLPNMDESIYLLRGADEMHLVHPPPDASVRAVTTHTMHVHTFPTLLVHMHTTRSMCAPSPHCLCK